VDLLKDLAIPDTLLLPGNNPVVPDTCCGSRRTDWCSRGAAHWASR
jgi:hypothetical protein